MPSRIIKEGINESRGLTSCSIFAQDLYKRLITYADDYGRFNADAEIMRARLYPLELAETSLNDLIEGLIELAGNGKIGFYTGHDREKVFGAFPHWADHQRLRESKKKSPEPEDTSVNNWYLQHFVSAAMKAKVIERDDCTCQICGKKIISGLDAKKIVKLGQGLYYIDHIVPVEQGGGATMENLRLTCPSCNLSQKKFYTFDEIIDFAVNGGAYPQESAETENLPESAENCGENQEVAENSGSSRNVAEFRGELRRVAASCGLNPREENPREGEGEEEGARARDAPRPFISDNEAARLARDQNEIFDRMEYVGFKLDQSVMDAALDLLSEHGKDKLLAAINECSGCEGNKLRYLKGVLRNFGKPRKSDDDDDELAGLKILV